MRSRSARLAALSVLAIATVACTKTLDSDGLERELKTDLEDELPATITSVDCPSDIEVEAGHTFTCTADDDGGASLTLEVTQSDDKGNVTWELVDAAPGA